MNQFETIWAANRIGRPGHAGLRGILRAAFFLGIFIER
jgi:hypothetical protein